MPFPKCLVCGFNEMPYAPVPFNVCPCCGTEFGVDDRKATHYDLRQAWIKAGMPWFDDITFPPSNWSPSLQLLQSDHGADLIHATSATVQGEQATVCFETRFFVSHDYKPYPVRFAALGA